MTSNRPYFIRAVYDWIADNDLTPYIVVDARHPDVDVPGQFIQEDKVVLNIAARAVQDLELGNDWISFGARFQGTPIKLMFPPDAVVAVYARENGEGMAFPEAGSSMDPPAGKERPSLDPKTTGGRPSLHIVK